MTLARMYRSAPPGPGPMGASRLAAICDADAVNRQCFADQAARIEALGGIDVCRNAHVFNHTPTPAEQAAMREDGR